MPERQGHRELRLLRIQVRSKDRGMSEARLRNISNRGLSATLESPAKIGEQLIFELNGIGSVVGTVCWVQGNRVGVYLEKAIDPARVVREEPVVSWMAPDYAARVSTGEVVSRRPGLRSR
jgi:hypothetical protein